MSFAVAYVGEPLLPVAGAETQGIFPANMESVSVTWSWGPNAEEGRMRLVGAGTIYRNAYLRIEIPGDPANHVFHAIAEDVKADVQAENGVVTEVTFRDTRMLLEWDQVFCAFNIAEPRIEGGKRVRVWSHLLPGNATAGIWTRTNAPYTAKQILDSVIAWTTGRGGIAWTYTGHDDLAIAPPAIDAQGGRNLADIINEVTEAVGLTFTVMGGPRNLVFVRKGESETVPTLVSPKKGDHRLGESVTNNPTRCIVTGDRNVYQCLNIEMSPDWNRNWEAFYDEALLVAFIHDNFTDPDTATAFAELGDGESDPDNHEGWFRARSRALEITVGEFAAEVTDVTGYESLDFKDPRRIGGRSRNEMPAVTYINTLLFRAFRPGVNGDFHINTSADGQGVSIPLSSLRMLGESLVKVSHNVSTGQMTYDKSAAPFGNGYAIAKGYLIGMDTFRMLTPEVWSKDFADDVNDLWSHVAFTIDDGGDGGQFIVFDEPVIDSTALIETVDGLPVLKAKPAFVIPQVKAALTFAAERFKYEQGVGPINTVVNASGLHGEFMINYNAALPNGLFREELPYADGQTASNKAAQIASAHLNKPWKYTSGGWVHHGITGQQLTDMIDRVTVTISPNGVEETVDFTTPRKPKAFVPQADYSRKLKGDALFPGQRELQQEARDSARIADIAKAAPTVFRPLVQALNQHFGIEPGRQDAIQVRDGTGTLPGGTPGWSAPNDARMAMPAATTSSHVVFRGVTARSGEDAAAPLNMITQGKALGRVKGPVSPGTALTLSPGNDYLVSQTDQQTLPAVAGARATIEDDSVKLIPIFIGGGAGGGGGDAGVWA